MLFLFLRNAFAHFPWVGQVLWTVAIVASVLLVILLLLGWLGEQSDGRNGEGWSNKLTDPLSVLVFVAFFGWASILGSLWVEHLKWVFLYAMITSFGAALVPRFLILLWRKQRKQKNTDPGLLLKSTGEVLQRIPPHQVGRGRVHLSLRAMPHDWEAVTVGAALTAGSHVRVVGVVDTHTVLVEPLDGSGAVPSSSAASMGQGIPPDSK